MFNTGYLAPLPEQIVIWGRTEHVDFPYPFQSLPVHARNAAFELVRGMQVPGAMVGMTLIQAMTLACQNLIDVELPIGKRAPVSQNLLMILKSGDRKTAVFNKVFEPFIEHDKQKKREYEDVSKSNESAIQAWRAKEKGLSRAISRAAAKGDDTCIAEVELAQHINLKPQLARVRTFLHQNVTPKSVMESLAGVSESICIANDEGHELFQGHMLREFGMLNRLWDSPEVMSIDRADNKILTAIEPRASLFIMTQWEPLNTYLTKRGEVARGSGFFARFLVCKPSSLQGYRNASMSGQCWHEMEKFHNRINELIDILSSKQVKGEVKREKLKFDSEATNRWYEINSLIEKQLAAGGVLHEFSDFGSKAMEITTRLAAVFEYFGSGEALIGIRSLNAAFEIMKWHITEYLYVFRDSVVSEVDRDKAKLIGWLTHSQSMGNGTYRPISKNEILQYGPVRSVKRLNPVLDVMLREGYLFVLVGPSRKRVYSLNSIMMNGYV